MPKPQAKYDVIIIGAGPAGYVSAIRCGQLGLKTACIDSWSDKFGRPHLGGAYLNAGCVASMALLESAKIYHTLTSGLEQHGISAENVTLNVAAMVRRKDQIVSEINQRIAGLFKAHQITHIPARGRLLQAGHVEIVPVDGSAPSCLVADHIILATGSSPLTLPCAPIDHDYIIDTSEALSLTAVPKRLAIIGAGIKGLEIASIWKRLGAEVILLEAQENFLNLPDQQIAREAYKIFAGQGMELRLGARVISAKKGNKKVTIEYQDHEGTHMLRVDRLIVAIGRKPSSEGLAAPEADLLLDESGYVHVDENCRTNLPGVYAVGDLTLLGPMLAHKGIEEGVFVAEQIAGLQPMINYDLLPSVIYTDPEIAWVGQTEQALRALGEPLKVGVFPFSASSRALTMGRTDGLVKIITHAETDMILGVHMIGSGASELIAEAVLAMEFSASSEDLAKTIHAHPTLSEALYEGALAIRKMALHLPISR
ncbi:dihydrolipoyl dehydrogenase [Methylomicrobium sp. Wu6]|uniref:dihydrolipoyl dehydrogenase n=1 Tax=Methylomicrobium sp. Wu6 TaxID=3107928 RepID=UPI002DD61885|nr:dihydrolipoyl dehydrogenase [Methylomicrobium sp. Wu6]MEC4750405.1 dihydrolipoyl dehydrogenase [Methylomicrobium sp. Wu6]